MPIDPSVVKGVVGSPGEERSYRGALARDTPGEAIPQSITRAEVLALFKNKNLLLVSIGGFGGSWATVGFGAWGNALMTRRYGVSPIEAGSVLAAFGLGAIVAKPVLGWLRDPLGGRSRKLLPIFCLLAFSVMLMVFAQYSAVLEFDLVAPLLGATAFGYTPLLYVLLTEASAASSTDSSSGLANAIWQVGGTLSPFAVGLVFRATQSFQFALGTLAVGPLCGALLLCFVETEAAPRDVVPVTLLGVRKGLARPGLSTSSARCRRSVRAHLAASRVARASTRSTPAGPFR